MHNTEIASLLTNWPTCSNFKVRTCFAFEPIETLHERLATCRKRFLTWLRMAETKSERSCVNELGVATVDQRGEAEGQIGRMMGCSVKPVLSAEMRTRPARKKAGQEAQLPDLLIFIGGSRSQIGASKNWLCQLLVARFAADATANNFSTFRAAGG